MPNNTHFRQSKHVAEMTHIQSNLGHIRSTLNEGVELVAVSKYHPISAVEEAYETGQRVFGESREQELKLKHEALPDDISWHFIGHLQTNKVKAIVPYVAMIETVDSLRLLKEIEKQAARIDRIIDVLLELHIASEDSKSGMTIEECTEILEGGEWKDMPHIRIRGIMTMATNTDDEALIRSEFLKAHEYFCLLKNTYFPEDETFNIRSYGMSGDYMVAQQCHTTMVRVGSAIFC